MKSLALSKFTHLFLALPNPPEELIKELNKIFFTFFMEFRPGPDKTKYNNLRFKCWRIAYD